MYPRRCDPIAAGLRGRCVGRADRGNPTFRRPVACIVEVPPAFPGRLTGHAQLGGNLGPRLVVLPRDFDCRQLCIVQQAPNESNVGQCCERFARVGSGRRSGVASGPLPEPFPGSTSLPPRTLVPCHICQGSLTEWAVGSVPQDPRWRHRCRRSEVLPAMLGRDVARDNVPRTTYHRFEFRTSRNVAASTSLTAPAGPHTKSWRELPLRPHASSRGECRARHRRHRARDNAAGIPGWV